MDPVIPATPPVSTLSANPRTPLQPAAQHTYGTRIRKNSIIKPSARLRQSPDPSVPPRRIKPVPAPKITIPDHPNTGMPTFPPPNVMLHPDDATSKVFIAIGRSFLSVDNRAMTIKDLAEMTMAHGLVCQNVSAAGQAITTYIRNHMQRCETQEDHPLLLRHILSGTSTDDDLLPALHSRTGGAHCSANPENRSTNFRRGTMVWYLSKATGAPCPFTRVGIQLCHYGENGKAGVPSGARERKRERDRQRRTEQCGQKRKRLLRGHKRSDCESGEEGKKPPKIKLTLRLKPSASNRSSPSTQSSASSSVIDLSKESDSDDDSRNSSMSVDSSSDEEEVPEQPEAPWSLPPYPKRSIEIPCYTPSVEYFPSFPSASPSYGASPTIQPFRRFPSVPCSIASPPPDSEDEDDDYHISMANARRFSTDMLRMPPSKEHLDWDLDFDSDGELETQWESPGPGSPSVSFAGSLSHSVPVKQEPQDVEGVQGMLDHWEPLDSNIDSSRVVEVVAKAAAGLIDVPGPEPFSSKSQIKIEEFESWDWDETFGSGSNSSWYLQHTDGFVPRIKQEDVDSDAGLASGEDSVRSHPDSSTSNLFAPLSAFSSQSPSTAGLSASAPSFSGLRRHSELVWKDVELLGPDSVHPQEFEDGEWQEGSCVGTVRMRANTQPSLPTFEGVNSFLSHTLVVNSALVCDADVVTQPPVPVLPASPTEPACVPPAPTEQADVVVVHTCQPCAPAICATQVEDIPVYRMALGSIPLLRRIDTDFVNLSPILAYLSIAFPPPADAVLINQGSTQVCGTWVPLPAAQAAVQGHPQATGVLDTFLSDSLFELFPAPLRDFHRSNAHGRMLSQFGPHFKSTSVGSKSQEAVVAVSVPEAWERGSASEWGVEDHDHLLSPHYSAFEHALDGLRGVPEDEPVAETPLSPTEQEIFQALCWIPSWEKEPVPLSPKPQEAKADVDASAIAKGLEEDEALPARDQLRRRSRRVANLEAVATRTRTRSQKRGTRNSLS